MNDCLTHSDFKVVNCKSITVSEKLRLSVYFQYVELGVMTCRAKTCGGMTGMVTVAVAMTCNEYRVCMDE